MLKYLYSLFHQNNRCPLNILPVADIEKYSYKCAERILTLPYDNTILVYVQRQTNVRNYTNL